MSYPKIFIKKKQTVLSQLEFIYNFDLSWVLLSVWQPWQWTKIVFGFKGPQEVTSYLQRPDPPKKKSWTCPLYYNIMFDKKKHYHVTHLKELEQNIKSISANSATNFFLQRLYFCSKHEDKPKSNCFNVRFAASLLQKKVEETSQEHVHQRKAFRLL